MTQQFLMRCVLPVVLATCLLSVPAQAESGRPNLLFIMADDHTSQAWGCYGSQLARVCPTPTIDDVRDGFEEAKR